MVNTTSACSATCLKHEKRYYTIRRKVSKYHVVHEKLCRASKFEAGDVNVLRSIGPLGALLHQSLSALLGAVIDDGRVSSIDPTRQNHEKIELSDAKTKFFSPPGLKVD
jgi:hypothetical protein